MSTHSDEVIADVQGKLSRFLQTFHLHLALCTKAIRGWPGELFDKRSTGAHGLLAPGTQRRIRAEAPTRRSLRAYCPAAARHSNRNATARPLQRV
jgi:hypothetical protein